MRKIAAGFLAGVLAVAACDMTAPPAGDSSSGAQSVRVARPQPPAPPGATCETIRDVVPPDLVALDGDLLVHLDEAEGLGIAEVSDPARPRAIARVPSVGTPLALHVRRPLAWMAYVDWDARASRSPMATTVIRAVDMRAPERPRLLGQATRPGIAAGTALVGGVLYVLVGSPAHVVSFRVDGDRLVTVDDLALGGSPAALAASPAGLAAVATSDRGVEVSWLDLPFDRPGVMTARGTRTFEGGFPAWERDLVSADEGRGVRLLTCATRACGPREDASIRVVDFADGARGVHASIPLGVAHGVPAVRFVDDWLYVADGRRLRAVSLHPELRVVGTTELQANASALRAQGDHLVAVGTTGAEASKVRVVLEDIDIREPSRPRSRGAVTFGDDWTWTRAEDDERAISIDPAADLVALPFATFHAADGRYATGAEVLALGSGAPTLRATFPAGGKVERAMFVRGRLLAVGGGTVVSLEQRPDTRLEVR